ncbi:MAG: SDR family NAD(P)-dependent oxidoreductase [Clostridia bacterium]|nr:SDR family NAD(P)-dependent oxidoreductase [Clostridia bacterium]
MDFINTPFIVQQTLTEWKRPVVELNGEVSEYPRIAGISSFGAGGANAHVVIEEYIPKGMEGYQIRVDDKNPAIIVLSAKNEERLKERARQLLTVIGEQRYSGADLADVAYTLQVGREAMEERLAVMVVSIDELVQKLKDFIEGKNDTEGLFRGQAKGHKDTLTALTADEEMQETIEKWIQRRKYGRMLELWVRGAALDWKKLYGVSKPHRISLPTYPFARERYWIPDSKTKPAGSTTANLSTAAFIHPLLHRNTSDLFEQRFSSTFTGEEFFLSDHVINGQKVLPGVAYLEMARAAVEQAAGSLMEGNIGLRLKNVVWTHPITVKEQPVQVHTGLIPEDTGEIAFEIYSEPGVAGSERMVHSTGKVVLRADEEDPVRDLESVQAQCTGKILSGSQLYEAFKEAGIAYGYGYQGIQEEYIGQGQALAKLSLPSSVFDTQNQFILHPSLMDSALQASIGLMVGSGEGKAMNLNIALLFAIQELEILSSCTPTMWALIRLSEGGRSDGKTQKFDIDICDEQGKICVRMRGVSSRTQEGMGQNSAVPDKVYSGAYSEDLAGTIMLVPVWDVESIEKSQIFPYLTDQIVVIGGNEENRSIIGQCYPKACVLEIAPKDTMDEIARKLEVCGSIDHILWIAPYNPLKSLDDDALIEGQNQGVLQVFRIIKALLSLGYADRDLGWSLITTQSLSIHKNDLVNPVHAGIQGLVGSLVKECQNWKIRLIDLEAGCNWPVEDIVTMPPDPRGEPWVYRRKEWYRQKLVPFHCPSLLDQQLYKTGGVYVVIGGSGGIGEAWSEYMIRTCKAQIIWVGRREKDKIIQAKLDRLAALGPAPHYIAADAAEKEALEQAYEEIIKRYSKINGVVHSVVVFSGQVLADMEEERFQAVLSSKVDVSVRIAQVFGKESLDFVMFFSSINSYLKAYGQSNYASGCTFKDAFARQLSREWPCAVKVMNWGYWGSVGAAAGSDDFHIWMERKGIGSIEPVEAMDALNVLLAGPMDQIALMKPTKPSGFEGIKPAAELITAHPRHLPSEIQNMQKNIPERRPPVQDIKPEENLQIKEINSLLCKLLLGQLQSVGLFTQDNQVKLNFKTKTALNNLNDKWLEESIAVLVRNNYLKHDGTAYTLADNAPVKVDEVWEKWDGQKGPWLQDVNLKAQVALVEVMLRALPEILTGKVPATDIMFPNSSMELVEGIYKNNLIADYFNEVLADAVISYLQERLKQDPSARISIIEIGAGTGGTSIKVFSRLEPYRQHIGEYCFTDISKAFLLHAEKEYGPQNPYLTYKIFNVEEPAAVQGIESGGYDIVIAANVLHATKDIRQTLCNAKAVLRTNGLIILNELCDKNLLSHLTFGLLEGWWLYEDQALRIPGCPGLTPETWQEVLEVEGFRSVIFPAREAYELGQQIIVAESDGIVRQKQSPALVKQGADTSTGRPAGYKASQLPGVSSQSHTLPETGKIQRGIDTTDQAAKDFVKETIISKLSESLKLNPDKIDAEVPFADYGLDSIISVKLVQVINQVLCIELDTTSLFDYSSVGQLATYIVSKYKDTIVKTLGQSIKQENSENKLGNNLEEKQPAYPYSKRFAGRRLLREFEMREKEESTEDPVQNSIAVVGMSGQFPGAKDVNAFWQNLIQGRDSVHELPSQYLDQNRYYRSEKQAGKTYCKWGGILEERDCFDPLFFNISPWEAQYMNPHQRLILQEGWKALEDAGYNPKTLANSKVGMFIGAEHTEYSYESFTGSSDAIIASRLSYYLDLKGPAFVVNTGCSSSGVAIHLACESLRRGESSVAIAGGVFANLDQGTLIKLSEIEMLSPTGRCKTFDESADGTVLSEGVAVVVLKSLRNAITDGDHIYGIIRGSGINQDGASNGITAPNGVAQEELISDVYKQYRINPEKITYVEAHGTGTKLGDPIEANALVRAFKQFTGKERYCAIGSAKSCIGHTGAVAGVTGLIKILLSLQHHKLPGLINFNKLNPFINLNGSAFYVSAEPVEWRPEDGGPLMAALNSFGHGGTNVHLVVQEYVPDMTYSNTLKLLNKENAVIIPLSAKSKERLKDYAGKLLEFLKDSAGEDSPVSQKAGKTSSDVSNPTLNLEGISYTLQIGREAMEERVAFLVKDIPELMAKLAAFLEGNKEIDNCWEGQVKQGKNIFRLFTSDEDMQETVEKWIAKGKMKKVAELWTQGFAIDWELFYGDVKPQRISLPTYPFARERYWVSGATAGFVGIAVKNSDIADMIHPLSQQNTSDLSELRFSPTFTGPSETTDTLMFEPVWKEQNVAKETGVSGYAQHIVMLCEMDGISKDNIESMMEGISCIILRSDRGEIRERFEAYAVKVFEVIQGILKGKSDGKVFVQVVVPFQGEGQLLTGLDGILKTAGLENPKLIGQLIEAEAGEDTGGIIEKLIDNRVSPMDSRIRYQGGKRYVSTCEEVDVSQNEASVPWKDRGIYLITGGMGGLGLIFAREIAQKASGTTLILTGRSGLDGEKQMRLTELQGLGARVEYKQADVSEREAVNGLIKSIQEDYGSLDGIIHSAGIIKDNYIIKKTGEEVREVMAPKTAGLVNLDEASRDMSLDFFILFSSAAGAMGNPGQADYSAANAFMDAYAGYRNSLVLSGQRKGRTVSLNWPLWKEGGMQVDKETVKMMQSTGMAAMETAAGIRALYQGLASGRDQVMVMEGCTAKIRGQLSGKALKARADSPKASVKEADRALLKDKALHRLKAFIKEITNLGIEKIEADEPLESYGIDSVMIIRMNQKFDSIFGELSKTLLFEYRTLNELAEYFVENHPQKCMEWTGIGEQVQSKQEERPSPTAGLNSGLPILTSPKKGNMVPVNFSSANSSHMNREPIAIVGMSGRYPSAKNLEEYWDNLKAGRDCIVEIPEERWPLDGFYCPDQVEAAAQGKSYSKWGGFIEGFADFDPLFFNISPREVMNIDPQERLFIESCWAALEDGGYTKEQLSKRYNGRVGVFAGITKTGFALYGPKLWEQGEQFYPYTSFGSVANRISYLLDLKGPSIPVDTMCSSSLTAIHEACEHLHRGECEMAIAGGVNLYLHPSTYIGLCAQRMLSKDGQCKSFGYGGNGFVAGEGVGVILLKPLSRAIDDQDNIYAVIRGSGINHGGKTNGYTVPNPTAQGELIRETLDKAGVNARTVSYIEAHGTGTELGDPIEITGLNQAFRKDSRDAGFCAIGSVKSNIGHLEAAAGVAGVTKVVLQMKHRKLVPSLHSEELNPNINFISTPFVVQQELEEWKRPVVTLNGETREYPRIAGVSSFGAGGVNAHVVIEEYIPNDREMNQIRVDDKNPAIIVLSAKNEGRLKEKARQLLTVISRRKYTDTNLADVAYTLQVGREAMEERLGVTAGSMGELEQKLKAFIEEESNPEGLYRGQAKGNNDTLTALTADEEMREVIEKWVQHRKYGKILELWVKGMVFDWNRLYDGSKPCRISLPTYPFARERYWIPDAVTKAGNMAGNTNTTVLEAENQDYPDAAIQESYELATFEEVWQEQAFQDASNEEIKTMVCFLSDEENRQEAIKEIQAFSRQTKIIFIAQGAAYQKQSKQAYSILPTDRNSYTDAFKGIREDYGEIDAVLYLWALEDTGRIRDYSCIVYILQAVAAAKLKPGRILLAAQFDNGLDRCYAESWIGFERSLGLIMPDTQTAGIYLEVSCEDRKEKIRGWMPRIWSELRCHKTESVLYQGGKRYICKIRPTVIQHGNSLLRTKGTYLITGGCGGLGLIFAGHLARQYSANLILTGRSPLTEEKQCKIKALEDSGSRVIYVQADVCDETAMREGVKQAKELFGEINGVIHAAGLEDVQSILEKDMQSFYKILDPKVKGTIELGKLFEQEALDFICYFSSSSAIIGDFGSCAYSVGNRFQMAYALYGDNKHPRSKKVIINWPLWKDGGMGSGESESSKMYLKSSGQRFLEAGEGVAVFEDLLVQTNIQHLVIAGQPSRVSRFLGIAPREQSSGTAAIAASSLGKGRRKEMKGLNLEQCLEWDLKESVSKLLKISRDRLDPEGNLADYGFDSISLAEFAALLTRHYGIEITPSLFFGYPTLKKLGQYFITEHKEPIEKFYSEDAALQDVREREQVPAAAFKEQRQNNCALEDVNPSESVQEPIAIIGMSGRFPEARNIGEMWTILVEGREAVTEIPIERFDWRQYYGDPAKEPGKTNCKWCGTIPGVSEFDPLFFEISPMEAETMDPRQRLLLQESWKALEDAGYGSEHIRSSKIGMFVGAEQGDYQFLVKENSSVTSNHNAVLAARLAYFLNLNGPVMAIDTACSSGLVAAHQACLSLRSGECDTAIAAGVTLLLTPGSYLAMGQAGMLSDNGKCYAFDKRANGIVPGEAVAVVVLKRLSKAVADGDPIYAVIKGSGINYDGKTNGITAPSGVAQARLLKGVYDQYQVNPAEIGYIVTHGTGTKLGDPVEVNALYEAFKGYTKRQGYCALTSTKTNFGHTFAASGLVSLISLVQALRYGTIPVSLHCEQENNYINWKESPFYVNKVNRPWTNSPGKNRTGAVSAFGMSGTNVHMAVQEYTREEISMPGCRAPYSLLVLSAKSQEALQEKIRDMIVALGSKELQEKGLASVSYTLLEGRQHFNHRCAAVVQDMENAVYVLEQAIGKEKLPNLFYGKVSRDFTGQKAIRQYAQDMIKQSLSLSADKDKYQETLYALAELYCQGYDMEWSQLFGDSRPCRVNLPTYPFAKESYWAPAPKDYAMTGGITGPASNTAGQPSILHHTQDLYERHSQDSRETDPILLFTVSYLTNVLSSVLKISPEKFDPEAGFGEYGMDSIVITQVNRVLEDAFESIPATLFFTYKSINQLAQYFVKEHCEKVKFMYQKLNDSSNLMLMEENDQYQTGENCQNQQMENVDSKVKQQNLANTGRDNLDASDSDIAIIGISGQYPQAADIDEFWENLKSGKDCIVEIPKERWDYRKYYRQESGNGGKSGGMYCKWGGFLSDADKFDPSFFSISPIEARYTDPQERLFLQTVSACFEDAGYSRKLLKDSDAGDGRASVGVFAGVTFNNFQLYLLKEFERGNFVPINSQIYSIANRVSYFFNLRGPSLSVDTACSSSLYAIHLACESIKAGECEMAIAGGVNLSLHPSKYMSLCVSQFASSDGRCHSFGKDGDGYVPGEGVGAVLLKPLNRAIADGDHIYAVIKGTAVNHDGKTYGYTVPNPVAQAEVIRKALESAKLDPRSISYVEAHGTGTKLGDPIEITGLNDAFKGYTTHKQYCAIGSVKSNIGHLEAAAGIAQLTKVILQMKHRKLAPTLIHSDMLNPGIDFVNTPFFVQQTLEEWKQPVIRVYGREEVLPRRAGISSFGAGGVNVHIVVEEHQGDSGRKEHGEKDESPVIVVLSAKKEKNLRTYAELLRNYLKNANKNQREAIKLKNIAYTLQTGREPMPVRLAFTAGNYGEAIAKLEMFLDRTGITEKTGVYTGNTVPGKGSMKLVDNEKLLAGLYENRELGKIAELWVNGEEFDWEMLYQNDLPCRVPLPTYPFSRERYWIEEHPDEFPEDHKVAPGIDMEQAAGTKEDKKQNTPRNSAILSELCNALEGERQEILEKYIQNLVAELLAYIPPDVPELEQGFFDMGMESIMVERFRALLEECVRFSIPDTAMFDYPNIRQLSRYLLELIPFSELESQHINREGHLDDFLLLNGADILNLGVSEEVDQMSLEEVADGLRVLLNKYQDY